MNPLRGGAADAPEEIVGQFVHARLLERRDLAALRIEAPHDVADRAVLAGGVHPLEHQQQRAAILGVQAIAEIVERRDVFIEFALGVLLAFQPTGVVGVEVAKPEFLARRQAQRLLAHRSGPFGEEGGDSPHFPGHWKDTLLCRRRQAGRRVRACPIVSNGYA